MSRRATASVFAASLERGVDERAIDAIVHRKLPRNLGKVKKSLLVASLQDAEQTGDCQATKRGQPSRIAIVEQNQVGAYLDGEADCGCLTEIELGEILHRQWGTDHQPGGLARQEHSNDLWSPRMREFVSDLRRNQHHPEEVMEHLGVPEADEEVQRRAIGNDEDHTGFPRI